VLPQQVATSAIVAEYLPAWGLRYNKSIAAALLTGILTDTIGFRTPNVQSKTLTLAAMLMQEGANLPELYSRALVTKSFEAIRFWGFGLEKIQKEGDLVYTTLTMDDRETAEYPGNDDADLVNVLSSIDCKVAVIFVEQKNERVKVSWRARPGTDVSQIALQFGGGGHAAAAGADIPGTLKTVQPQVLSATRTLLAHSLGKNGR
jgi:phosphoesterase RecJ-like protein